MSSIARFTLGAALLASGASPLAAEFNAETYHQSNCTRCHDTSVYTRENRKMRSYPMLETQVARCDANLATKLFPGDLEQLTDYLNTEFYKFSK